MTYSFPDFMKKIIHDFPDFMDLKNMTDAECHEETIRLALLDQGCSAFELPDMIEQLVAENLDPSDIEARILQLGWGLDETWEEFLEGQRLANLHAPPGWLGKDKWLQR